MYRTIGNVIASLGGMVSLYLAPRFIRGILLPPGPYPPFGVDLFFVPFVVRFLFFFVFASANLPMAQLLFSSWLNSLLLYFSSLRLGVEYFGCGLAAPCSFVAKLFCAYF